MERRKSSRRQRQRGAPTPSPVVVAGSSLPRTPRTSPDAVGRAVCVATILSESDSSAPSVSEVPSRRSVFDWSESVEQSSSAKASKDEQRKSYTSRRSTSGTVSTHVSTHEPFSPRDEPRKSYASRRSTSGTVSTHDPFSPRDESGLSFAARRSYARSSWSTVTGTDPRVSPRTSMDTRGSRSALFFDGRGSKRDQRPSTPSDAPLLPFINLSRAPDLAASSLGTPSLSTPRLSEVSSRVPPRISISRRGTNSSFGGRRASKDSDVSGISTRHHSGSPTRPHRPSLAGSDFSASSQDDTLSVSMASPYGSSYGGTRSPSSSPQRRSAFRPSAVSASPALGTPRLQDTLRREYLQQQREAEARKAEMDAISRATVHLQLPSGALGSTGEVGIGRPRALSQWSLMSPRTSTGSPTPKRFSDEGIPDVDVLLSPSPTSRRRTNWEMAEKLVDFHTSQGSKRPTTWHERLSMTKRVSSVKERFQTLRQGRMSRLRESEFSMQLGHRLSMEKERRHLERSRWRDVVILLDSFWLSVTMLFLMMSLTVISDIRLAFFDKSADFFFDVFTLCCLVFFTVDAFIRCLSKDNYICSLLFLMDLSTSFSLLFDFSIFLSYAVGDTVTELQHHVEVPADVGGNSKLVLIFWLVHFLRAIRLIRVTKVYGLFLRVQARLAADGEMTKGPGDELSEDATYQGLRVAEKLSVRTTWWVMKLVITMLIAAPWLQTDASDSMIFDSALYGADVVSEAFRKYARASVVGQDSSRYKAEWERQLLLFMYYHNDHATCLKNAPSDSDCALENLYRLSYVGQLVEYGKNVTSYIQELSTNVSDWDQLARGPTEAKYATGELQDHVKEALRTPWSVACSLSSKYTIGGVSMRRGTPCPWELLRPSEFLWVTPAIRYQANADMSFRDKLPLAHVFMFDMRPWSRWDAKMSLLETIVVLLIIVLMSSKLNKERTQLIIKPLERMIKKVDEIRKNPMSALMLASKKKGKATVSKAHCFVKQDETSILENTIIKLGSLVALCFGEAGSEIVGSNMDNTASTVDALIPGQRVTAIYGYCQIRSFTEITCVLKERTMVFVNRVAEIVHRVADEHLGAPNWNADGAFLLVWRVGLYGEHLLNKVADLSVIAFANIVAEVTQNHALADNTRHPAFLAMSKDSWSGRVGLSIGLHIGWSIEGTVGSSFKVNASYLSQHVSLAVELGQATTQYGLVMLMSEDIVRTCNAPMHRYFRAVDCVKICGHKTAHRIFAFDMDPEVLRVKLHAHHEGSIGSKSFEARERHERMKHMRLGSQFQAHDQLQLDPSMRQMRDLYSLEFFQEFEKGFLNYTSGEWDVAALAFGRASEMLESKNRPEHWLDGPSCVLLDYVNSFDCKAPSDWPGYREVVIEPEGYRMCRRKKQKIRWQWASAVAKSSGLKGVAEVRQTAASALASRLSTGSSGMRLSLGAGQTAASALASRLSTGSSGMRWSLGSGSGGMRLASIAANAFVPQFHDPYFDVQGADFTPSDSKVVVRNDDKLVLRFESLVFQEINHDVFTRSLLEGFREKGASESIIAQLKVSLREGSVIADISGTVQALDALRHYVLENRVTVMGVSAAIVSGSGVQRQKSSRKKPTPRIFQVNDHMPAEKAARDNRSDAKDLTVQAARGSRCRCDSAPDQIARTGSYAQLSEGRDNSREIHAVFSDASGSKVFQRANSTPPLTTTSRAIMEETDSRRYIGQRKHTSTISSDKRQGSSKGLIGLLKAYTPLALPSFNWQKEKDAMSRKRRLKALNQRAANVAADRTCADNFSEFLAYVECDFFEIGAGGYDHSERSAPGLIPIATGGSGRDELVDCKDAEAAGSTAQIATSSTSQIDMASPTQTAVAFHDLDTNGDGVIDRSELTAAVRAQAQAQVQAREAYDEPRAAVAARGGGGSATVADDERRDSSTAAHTEEQPAERKTVKKAGRTSKKVRTTRTRRGSFLESQSSATVSSAVEAPAIVQAPAPRPTRRVKGHRTIMSSSSSNSEVESPLRAVRGDKRTSACMSNLESTHACTPNSETTSITSKIAENPPRAVRGNQQALASSSSSASRKPTVPETRLSVCTSNSEGSNSEAEATNVTTSSHIPKVARFRKPPSVTPPPTKRGGEAASRAAGVSVLRSEWPGLQPAEAEAKETELQRLQRDLEVVKALNSSDANVTSIMSIPKVTFLASEDPVAASASAVRVSQKQPPPAPQQVASELLRSQTSQRQSTSPAQRVPKRRPVRKARRSSLELNSSRSAESTDIGKAQELTASMEPKPATRPTPFTNQGKAR